MNKVSRFKEGHSSGNLGGHEHEGAGRNLASIRLPQIFEEIPLTHVLGDDVEGCFAGADTQQLNQILVVQILHHRGFGEEVWQRHGFLLQRFDSDRSIMCFPECRKYIPVLAASEFVLHHDFMPINLPFIRLRGGERENGGDSLLLRSRIQ